MVIWPTTYNGGSRLTLHGLNFPFSSRTNCFKVFCAVWVMLQHIFLVLLCTGLMYVFVHVCEMGRGETECPLTIWHCREMCARQNPSPDASGCLNALTWLCSAEPGKWPVWGPRRKPPAPWSPHRALHPPHLTAAGPLLAFETYRHGLDTPALTGSSHRWTVSRPQSRIWS